MSRNNLFRRIKSSIFTRLLLILIVGGLFINILVALSYKFLFEGELNQGLHNNADQYLSYIVEDIGIPPDTVRARELAEHLHILIHIQNDSLLWATSPELLTLDIEPRHTWHVGSETKMSWHKGRLYSWHSYAGTKFLFVSDFWQQSDDREGIVLLLIALLTLILTGVFFLIRKTLQPLNWLNEGVSIISAGNFEHRVPEKGPDELRALSTSFNHMTEKLQEMIRARDQLLLDVSHELRSPLTRMRVALGLLPESANRSSIEDDISGMEKMITEILEAERINSPHGGLRKEMADLGVLIVNEAQILSDRLPGIRMTMPSDVLKSSIDIDRMKIVIHNLLDNALKYSQSQDNHVEITLTQAGYAAKISIKDHGDGIAAAELPYIFEPFYRVDKSRSYQSGGYGLGLAICKQIIEAHDGSIDIKSIVGEGSEVLITLPIVESL